MGCGSWIHDHKLGTSPQIHQLLTEGHQKNNSLTSSPRQKGSVTRMNH